MIGIDTNIFVRYITQDDEGQAELATNFIEKNCTVTKPGFINQIVICELIWVLRIAYGYNKPMVIRVIEKLLQSSEIIIENSSYIRLSLELYQEGDADFSDYLIGLSNLSSGCDFTITFDRKAAVNKSYRLLK